MNETLYSSIQNASFNLTQAPSLDSFTSGNKSMLYYYLNYNLTANPSIFYNNTTSNLHNLTMQPSSIPSKSRSSDSKGPTITPTGAVATTAPSQIPTITIIEKTNVPSVHSSHPTIDTSRIQNINVINTTQYNNSSVINFDESQSGNSSPSKLSVEMGLFIVCICLSLFLLFAIAHSWYTRSALYAAIPKQVVSDTREDSITDTLRRLSTSDWLELTPEQIDDMFPEKSPTRSRANSQPTTYEVDERVLLDREANSPFV